MKHSWLVIADLGSRQGQREERIYLAADLNEALFETVLKEQITQVDELDWDEREGALRAERQVKVGELILSRAQLANLGDEARVQALLNFVRRKGLELLPWRPSFASGRRGWSYCAYWMKSRVTEASGPTYVMRHCCSR